MKREGARKGGEIERGREGRDRAREGGGKREGGGERERR